MKKLPMLVALASVVVLLALLAGKSLPTVRARQASERADKYLLQRNFSAAAAELRESIRLKPNRDLQYTLGITLMRGGRRDEAMAVMQELSAQSDRIGGYARTTLAKMRANPNLSLRRP